MEALVSGCEPTRAGRSPAGRSASGHQARRQALEAVTTTTDTYDRWFERRWGRYAFAVEWDALLGALGPVHGGLVLDAGCGTGRFGVELSRAGARVVGLDIDMSMLAVAAARLSGMLVRGDLQRLPFLDGAFDVAVAVTVLEFVPDPDRALAELIRVTRPGGRVVVGALNRRSPWGLLHRRRSRQWRQAHLFTSEELAGLAARHGAARALAGALYAPGAFPGLARLGPILERIGRRFPGSGAFQVLAAPRR